MENQREEVTEALEILAGNKLKKSNSPTEIELATLNITDSSNLNEFAFDKGNTAPSISFDLDN